MSVLYNSEKANVVADVLSQMSMGSVTNVVDEKKYFVRDVRRCAKFFIALSRL